MMNRLRYSDTSLHSNVAVAFIAAFFDLILTAESRTNDGSNNYLILNVSLLGLIFRSGRKSNQALTTELPKTSLKNTNQTLWRNKTPECVIAINNIG